MTTVTFDTAKLGTAPTTSIKPNPWNPKVHDSRGKDYRKVVKSVEANGLRAPIVVRHLGDGYEVIDGEQRWRAATELGLPHVPIYDEGQLGDDEAKALTVWYQQQVPFDALLEAQLAAQLHAAQVPVPYDEAEMARLLELANFRLQDELAKPDAPPPTTRSIAFTLDDEQYLVVRNALNTARDDVGYENDAAVLVAWAEGQG